jgi:hypothetical protein
VYLHSTMQCSAVQYMGMKRRSNTCYKGQIPSMNSETQPSTFAVQCNTVHGYMGTKGRPNTWHKGQILCMTQPWQ